MKRLMGSERGIIALPLLGLLIVLIIITAPLCIGPAGTMIPALVPVVILVIVIMIPLLPVLIPALIALGIIAIVEGGIVVTVF